MVTKTLHQSNTTTEEKRSGPLVREWSYTTTHLPRWWQIRITPSSSLPQQTQQSILNLNTCIDLRYIFSGELRSIYMFELINDIVGPEEVNTYKLTIGAYYKRILGQKDLSIDMNPFEGNPDIFVTTPPLPASLSDYKW